MDVSSEELTSESAIKDEGQSWQRRYLKVDFINQKIQ